MTVRKLNYALKTDRGVYEQFKRNVIVVGDTDYAEFDTALDAQDYIKQRKIAVLNKDNLTNEAGELDEAKVNTFYEQYYSNLESIAVPWEPGLTLTKNQPQPVSYEGKLYEVIQGHTTQSDWAPDIVPALFSEIQAPGGSGYPEWVQPTGAQDAYDLGAQVTHNGKNWESTIPANTTEPGTLLPLEYWVEI